MSPAATLLFCLALILPTSLAVAADDSPAPAPIESTVAARQQGGESVMVLNRKVAVFRSSLFGVPADERARRTTRRVSELLTQPGPGAVTVQIEPQGSLLLIDGSMAIALAPKDADPLAGESLESVTEATRQALTQAIDETRESRDRGHLIRATWRSGIATGLFLVFAWVLLRFRRAVMNRLTALLRARSDRVHIAGTPLLQATWLRTLVRWFVKSVVFLVVAVALYEWLSFVLTQFAYTRPWGEALGGYLVGAGKQIGLGILSALPDLFIAFLIFMMALVVTSTLRPVFDRAESGLGRNTWLDEDTAAPTRRLLNIGIWLFALVMAYPYLPGSGSEAFKGVSVLVGLMITIGGSSLMGQGASGLILMYSKTLRTGEYVRINDLEGTVTELGTFTTRIRTGLGEELSIPNAVVLGTTNEKLFACRDGRLRSGYGRHHRLRHTLATGARNACRCGQPDRWRTSRSQAASLQDVAVRFLRGVSTGLPGSP